MSCHSLGHSGQKLGICRLFKADRGHWSVFDEGQSENMEWRRRNPVWHTQRMEFHSVSWHLIIHLRWAYTCEWKRYPSVFSTASPHDSMVVCPLWLPVSLPPAVSSHRMTLITLLCFFFYIERSLWRQAGWRWEIQMLQVWVHTHTHTVGRGIAV